MRTRLSALLVRLTALVLVSLVLAVSGHGQGAIIYVKNTATGANNGTSWTDAYVSLDAAINTAVDGDQIWVAASLTHYVPSDPLNGFLVNERLRILGGFRGNEATLAQRAGLFSQTVLNARLVSGGGGAKVVSVIGVSGTPQDPIGATIDGFQIIGAAVTSTDGGGVYSSQSDILVANCTIASNFAARGAGIYFNGGGNGNLLRIKSCTIEYNTAGLNTSGIGVGAGLYAQAVRGEVVNTTFHSNSAEERGGGVYLANMVSQDTLRFMNCVFWNNTADLDGGGTTLDTPSGGSPGRATLVCCTFNQNASGGTDGIASIAAPAKIYGSIFWGNGATEWSGNAGSFDVKYSNFAGTSPWTGSDGNISADPAFSNPSLGRLRLTSGSPSIDVGTYCFTPPDLTDVDNDGNFGELVDIDADGLPRLVDHPSTSATGDTNCSPSVYCDMGAFEFQ